MNNSGMQTLYNFQTYIVDPAILLVFTAGFCVFMWGLVQFMWHLKDDADHNEGVQHMLWGIVGMFIMVSVWGILTLVANTIGAELPSPGTEQRENSPSGLWI